MLKYRKIWNPHNHLQKWTLPFAIPLRFGPFSFPLLLPNCVSSGGGLLPLYSLTVPWHDSTELPLCNTKYLKEAPHSHKYIYNVDCKKKLNFPQLNSLKQVKGNSRNYYHFLKFDIVFSLFLQKSQLALIDFAIEF